MLTQKGVHDVTLSEKRSDRKVVVPTACWALCIIYDSVSVNATHVHYICMYGSTYIEVLYIYMCVYICMCVCVCVCVYEGFPQTVKIS